MPPSQFVPGCFLPPLLEKLGETPMILRTESFVGCDGAALPELLTLLVWHDPDAPANPDESGQPMQCVNLSVNGTGRISRWFYDRQGKLPTSTWLRGCAQVGSKLVVELLRADPATRGVRRSA